MISLIIQEKESYNVSRGKRWGGVIKGSSFKSREKKWKYIVKREKAFLY